MRSRPILALVLLGVLALGLTGCTQIKAALTPKPIIKHVKIAAKVAKPGATIEGTLKPGAPADLPLWEGAGVVRNHLTKSDAGNSWLATLSTSDPYDVVVAGMVTGFQNGGWQVASRDVSSGDASTTVLTVSGPDAAGVVTVAAQKDLTTQIDYVITKSTK